MSERNTTKYTGRLRAGPGPGEVQGWIADAWGWTITITGKRDEAGGGYLLVGELGEVPDSLRIPAIDGET